MRAVRAAVPMLAFGGVALAANTTWQQIAIGGGGYVLQTYFSAVDSNVYMKTDVGGVYRRSPSNNSWIPLLDWAGPDNADFYSVSALAVDPSDGSHIFALTGGYWAWSNCSLLASADAGTTWVVTNASQGWGLRCGGNENDRNVGDRMAVHPSLPGTIAVGGSDGAVYVSVDAFATGAPARVQVGRRVPAPPLRFPFTSLSALRSCRLPRRPRLATRPTTPRALFAPSRGSPWAAPPRPRSSSLPSPPSASLRLPGPTTRTRRAGPSCRAAAPRRRSTASSCPRARAGGACGRRRAGAAYGAASWLQPRGAAGLSRGTSLGRSRTRGPPSPASPSRRTAWTSPP